jgi:hypothetical protein
VQTIARVADASFCGVGYSVCMPVALPLITRQEITREYRPDEKVTIDSAIHALRAKKALSSGLSVTLRTRAGALSGRMHLYSALNRDAARAARRGDYAMAARIGEQAARLDASPEAERIAQALTRATTEEETSSGVAYLARALSLPEMMPDVVGLQRRIARARRRLNIVTDATVVNGRVAVLDSTIGVLKLDGGMRLAVPAEMLREAGLSRVGAAASAIWELLPGGRTLLTVEPAIDAPDLNELGEPLVDIYGTPWGQVLRDEDSEALQLSGTPTIAIPQGIPAVT